MAEGWLRHLGGGLFDAFSAGTVATEVRPEAITVMGEVNIDLSEHKSKTLDRYLYEPFHLVVTVCDHARDSCPTFPNAVEQRHWSIADPSGVQGSPEERLSAFRMAREELCERIVTEIVTGSDAVETEHFRRLERMYLTAPTNAYYRPEIHISKGQARVTIGVRPEFFHAAGGVHGSVYFKALDDACFFAASSLVADAFVLTSQFNIHLTRPVSEGQLTAVGRVRHATNSSYLVAGELIDDRRNLLARGEGTFVRSSVRLTRDMGYS